MSDDEPDKKAAPATRRRGPRKVSEKRLNNIALHYLARYSATTESLRQVLMRRVSASARGVAMKLREKGVASADIDAALAAARADMPDLDLAAALALARRRRLGPYRASEARAGRRDKDLAALARAGFSYDIARRVVEADSIEALEDLAETGGIADGRRYVTDEDLV